MRSKAFFVNGGAGRVISSIPAFEKYAENHDDFIIVCEGGTDFFKGHPTLDHKVYDHWHKNLFQEHINRETARVQNHTEYGITIIKSVIYHRHMILQSMV